MRRSSAPSAPALPSFTRSATSTAGAWDESLIPSDITGKSASPCSRALEPARGLSPRLVLSRVEDNLVLRYANVQSDLGFSPLPFVLSFSPSPSMNAQPSHFDLRAAARQIMLENGFEPEFPTEVRQQLAQIKSAPPQTANAQVRDLRHLLWSSIDNDTSRDLDQIEVAERLPDGSVRIMIGIADVDAFVPKDTPIDRHAARETTTVYTGVCNFPMLPEELSTGTTSLLEVDGKLSVVTEFVVDNNGVVGRHSIYRALVVNKAQLTYNSVGAWLEGRGPAPAKVAASPELQAQLKLQDEVAQRLKNERHRHGALSIETTEVHPVVLNDQIIDLQKQEKNRATELIEDFMIAANGVVARTLQEARVSSIRRVVKTP